MTATPTKPKPEQILVRVPAEVYSALQLAQPFVGRRSMQDLLVSIIDEFLSTLREQDPGFEQALVGLRESLALREGVLAKRRAHAIGGPDVIQDPDED
ncbi:MAG: hypothetical protein J2P25_19780 [Nocardiopsaceae bacterium]|nr:hypothetical protein [Nocardiopsaceae bacterium]